MDGQSAGTNHHHEGGHLLHTGTYQPRHRVMSTSFFSGRGALAEQSGLCGVNVVFVVLLVDCDRTPPRDCTPCCFLFSRVYVEQVRTPQCQFSSRAAEKGVIFMSHPAVIVIVLVIFVVLLAKPSTE